MAHIYSAVLIIHGRHEKFLPGAGQSRLAGGNNGGGGVNNNGGAPSPLIGAEGRLRLIFVATLAHNWHMESWPGEVSTCWGSIRGYDARMWLVRMVRTQQTRNYRRVLYLRQFYFID